MDSRIAQCVVRGWTEGNRMIDKALRKATAEALCGDLPGRCCPETERVIDGE